MKSLKLSVFALLLGAAPLLAAVFSHEALGPSSRRTGLVISEIMYRPAARADGQDLEFVELFNSQLWFEDISGYRLSGAIEFTFPAGTTLPARSFLVVAKNPAHLRSAYGISVVAGPYTDSLHHRSRTLRLHHRNGAVLLEIRYSTDPPWPVAADGAGHSLVLGRPSYGENDPLAWAASDRIGGSPGEFEPAPSDALRAIMINELLVRSDTPGAQFVELYNHSREAKDLSGCALSDDALARKCVFPQGTIAPPAGFLVLGQTQLGFALNPTGGTVYLKNADQSRIIDAVRYGGQAVGVALGRSPNGASTHRELARPSPGAANSAPLIRDIVINEIMYAPISGRAEDEYVELYNKGTRAVDLGGWKFVSGIDFTFPPGTSLPADGYLVVAKNAANLRINYPNLSALNTVGDFRGRLSNRGQKLILAMPDKLTSAAPSGGVVTSTVYVIADEVTYGVRGRWGKWAREGGSSLELIDPRSDHQLASNWADSDETTKSEWTTIEAMGVLDNGIGAADTLHLLLMGEGECLIDGVEVIGPGDTNRIANSTFDNGLTGWVAQGSHGLSGFAPGAGVGGTSCLHVRSSHRGDTGANRIRARLGSSLAPRTSATIRAKGRWLRGFPEVLLRLRGNYLEAAQTLSLPTNLGSPGARNSRAIANAAPAIHEVKHFPVVPATNQTVLITARANDPDGIASVLLKYRVDPGVTLLAVPMLDDGTAGDEIAGDEVYSARIPARPTGTLVAFHVEAADQFAIPATTRFPSDAPTRECLVRFGDPPPPGAFGTYRLWITQATATKWATRLKLSNEPLDATFVYGDERAIYNIGALYSGSPYHSPSYSTPTGSLCNYIFVFPEDDPLLGVTDFKLTAPGNNPGDDETAQREQTAYWIAAQLGLPFNYQRNINLFVNGVRRGRIFEDSQIPNSEVVEEWFPGDDDGELYKIAGWFEFDDNASNFQTTWTTLQRFTTTGGAKKLARYRWNWQRRGAELSTSNYTNLFNLVDAVNASNAIYTASVESQIDVEQWMRIFAVEHVVGNWDSYGNNNGQNMFAYKPRLGPWQLLIWDFDIVLGLGGYADGPTTSLFKAVDPVITRMNSHPPFRRAYWRALRDTAHGPLQDPALGALLDAKYAAFRTNGAAVTSPNAIKTFVSSRRNYILQQLKTVASDFAITSNHGDDWATDQNSLTLAGRAPVEVKTIRVNGSEYPTTWTTVTNWSLKVPLRPGFNTLALAGHDASGNLLPAHTATVNVTSTRPDPLTPDHVVINEWMSANIRTLANPIDGAFSDWFELFNPTDRTVDLSGFSLSDELSNPAKCVIPAGITLGPRSYLLIWADRKPGLNGSNRDLHADFKLSRESGLIALFSPAGQIVDFVQYSAQVSDVSQGRWPDGGPAPSYSMPIPTPRAPNFFLEPGRDRVRAAKVSSTINGVAVTWDAQPGVRYHLQYKNHLSEPIWHNLPGDVFATGPTASKTDATIASSPQRFYRIQTIRWPN
ncbi:MAG: lamin tail domain-containing protein [Verrucomicrobia bacterium]|nr:lamin tail domain-containing protein [Verrucomicrobiota bacterium]